MLQDLKAKYFLEKDAQKYLSSHQDYGLSKEWKQQRDTCAEFIKDHLEACRTYLQELGVDPLKFALNFVGEEFQGDTRQAEARRLAQKWDLPRLSPEVVLHQCDIRREARTALLKAWQASMIEAPDKSQIILTYTNKDTRELNQQVRQLMKEAKGLDTVKKSPGVLKGEITIAWLETKGDKQVDFNDLLKDYGVQKIKQVLEEQLPDVVTFKKDME